MKITKADDSQVTILVPKENGEIVEFNFNKSDTREIAASDLEVEELRSHCIPIAIADDYRILVLDF